MVAVVVSGEVVQVSSAVAALAPFAVGIVALGAADPLVALMAGVVAASAQVGFAGFEGQRVAVVGKGQLLC